jgi:transglutaminase-like putative cysteine protease
MRKPGILQSSPRPEPPLELTVRVGCVVSYQAEWPAPILLLLKPHLDLRQSILEEQLMFGSGLPTEPLVDSHGNVVYRTILAPGVNEIRHDAIFSVPSRPDNDGLPTAPVPIERLPVEVLRYTLPSRYCDSDKLMNFAWQQFGHLPHGVARVHATCDWVHANIEYRYGWGNPTTSAADVLAQGYGVCRDFAHLAVALCRAFNLPTRYVSGHLPDIGVIDPGTGMDFHAYCEVFLGGSWHTFDPRNNRTMPRIGRIKIAHGLDAVDCALSTTFGQAILTNFEVWAYQIRRSEVRVGDPIDLSKRLDGTTTVQLVA